MNTGVPNQPDSADAAQNAADCASWWRCWFEEAEDAQIVCRANGAIVEANSRAQQLFGVGQDLASTKLSILAELTPASSQKLEELLKRSNGKPASLQSVTLVTSGRLNLIADLHVTPLGGGFSLVTIRDASRRWRMESHVTRLITAVNATSDVLFVTDAEFRVTFVNSAFQIVTGYNVEDVLGKRADFLRAFGQEAKIQDSIDAVLKGSDWQGEMLNACADGSTYPVETSISPIYDRNGSFLGCVAFERDITQKKVLQEALRLERNFVVSIIDSLDAAVYTTDRQFRLTHVNKGWKTLPREHGWLELTSPPEPGKFLLDLVNNTEKRLELEALFGRVLRDGKSQDMVSIASDGRHWLVKVAPLFAEGSILGLVYVVTDRTKYYELERQLFQAQKMETIGALAAGVAHDFNNLIQAIRGNVSVLLLEQRIDPKLFYRLEKIDEAAGQAADITQQLLSFSRTTDGTESVLDFNEMIRGAGEMAQRSVMSKVAVKIEPAAQAPKVRMHPTRAQQLLLNLCVNAQDAMPNGGELILRNTIAYLTPEQAVRTQSPAGAAFVRCSISDTGTGIPDELLRKIFDPFFTTKGTGKGTGLGLSIVHSIASQSGGFLDVESEVGRGTTFHIYLPTVDAALSEKAKTKEFGPMRGSGRILVVDDLELVLDFTQTYLQAAGYEVFTAESAEAAMEFLELADEPIDLVLTDYNMTGKNGEQLIRDASSRWPNMKFILASGYLEPNERRNIEERYQAHVLNKPYNIREAAELISKLLPKPAGPD